MVECLMPKRTLRRSQPLVTAQPAAPQEHELAGPVVLIVDDEPSLRDVLQRGLQQDGFRVLVADNGLTALDLYQQHWQSIAVVVLDVRLRGIDGLQTLRCLAHINPKVRACFISGGMGSFAQLQMLSAGAVRVLWKPFPLDAITTAVRQIIDENECEACRA